MATVQEIINNSGYPLQIHLEKLIEDSFDRHHWRILAKEHRWVNAATGEEGYVDLILEHRYLFVKLVVECKKIDGKWTFLLPTLNPKLEHRVRSFCVDYKTFHFMWVNLDLAPRSFEAIYCVMEINGKKDSRTLEKFSGDLLISLEYIAREDTELMKIWRDQDPGFFARQSSMFYLPIIVTTATLKKSIFNPTNIDIKTGRICDSLITPVEYIRLRKNLATSISIKTASLKTLRELNHENDRTVFIVGAENFIDFLCSVDD